MPPVALSMRVPWMSKLVPERRSCQTTRHTELLVDTPTGLRFLAAVTDERAALRRFAFIRDGSADGMSVGFAVLRRRTAVRTRGE